MGVAQKQPPEVESEPSGEPRAAQNAADDLMSTLLESVRRATSEAAATASRSKHAVDLAIEVYGHRADLASALGTVDEMRGRDEHDLFLREVGRAYYRYAQSLEDVDGRVELVSRWLEVLLVALGETQRIFDAADAYRQDDSGVSPESREAVKRKAAHRWHRVA